MSGEPGCRRCGHAYADHHHYDDDTPGPCVAAKSGKCGCNRLVVAPGETLGKVVCVGDPKPDEGFDTPNMHTGCGWVVNGFTGDIGTVYEYCSKCCKGVRWLSFQHSSELLARGPGQRSALCKEEEGCGWVGSIEVGEQLKCPVCGNAARFCTSHEVVGPEGCDCVITCSSGCGLVLHRWRPNPDAGPYWRCSECGEVTEANEDEEQGVGDVAAMPGFDANTLDMVAGVLDGLPGQLDLTPELAGFARQLAGAFRGSATISRALYPPDGLKGLMQVIATGQLEALARASFTHTERAARESAPPPIPDCACGHLWASHSGDGGHCEVRGCPCLGYRTPGAIMREEAK